MDGLKNIIDNLKERLGTLSFNQKVMLGAVATASIISVVVFSTWLQKDEMVVLFAHLSTEDAGACIEELDKQGVKYELTDGGATIKVPENEKYRLRIDLSNKNVIASSTVGYDIFDGKQYGLTEFLQNVQYKRAVEGELTRTIENIIGVQSARVHLVMPKASIFNKGTSGATASVILSLGRGIQFENSQVAGIQSLIAFSVQNLDPKNVRIIDSNGRLISSTNESDEIGRSATQMAMTADLENRLKAKAEAMLAKRLGYGNFIVEVNATQDFEKKESERKTFDPQGIVVLSEERKEKTNTETGDVEENSMTNNELSSTVEHVVSEVGKITHLSVSVMVDGHYEPAEDGGAPTYVPLTEAEIGNLRRIVSAAVGLNTIRGDQIELINFQFDQTDEFGGTGLAPDWIGIATQYGGKFTLIILFGVLALALKKSLGNALATAMQPGGFSAAGGSGIDDGEDPESFDGIPEIDDQIMDDIQDYASENPERVAEVIQSWINEIDLGPAVSARAGE